MAFSVGDLVYVFPSSITLTGGKLATYLEEVETDAKISFKIHKILTFDGRIGYVNGPIANIQDEKPLNGFHFFFDEMFRENSIRDIIEQLGGTLSQTDSSRKSYNYKAIYLTPFYLGDNWENLRLREAIEADMFIVKACYINDLNEYVQTKKKVPVDNSFDL